MYEKNEEEIKPETNRYNNSKVFKLINFIDDFFYNGSTCTSLSKRLNHKTDSEKYPQRKVYAI